MGQLEPWLQANTAVTPLELLTAGRQWIALWVALLTAACFFPLRKLWGAPLAALAVLMLAWDPFLLALTRLLHMDGLLAYLCVVALLALLAWLHGGRSWRYLILSGVMTGLALLSKSTTLILLPTVGLLLLIEGVRQFRQGERKLWTLVLAYGAWIGLAAAVIVALWPALWVVPIKALDTVLGGLRVHSAGHDSLNFFLGRPTDQPGAALLSGRLSLSCDAWRAHWADRGRRVDMAPAVAFRYRGQATQRAGLDTLCRALCRRDDAGRQDV